MARRKYRHEWDDLAVLNSDYMTGWGAFEGYRGSVEFEGLEPDKAEMEHDEERDVARIFYANKKGELIRATIALERQPCTYGGARVYWKAPCCGARVRQLALLSDGVLCGGCGSITHRSKRKSGVQRLIHKADVLANRLGCPNWFTEPKERPKGMRRDTFSRLADEKAELVAQANRIIAPRIGRAVRRGMAAKYGAYLRYGL